MSKEHKKLLAEKEETKISLLEKEVKEFFDKYHDFIDSSIRDAAFYHCIDISAPESFRLYPKEFNKLLQEHAKKTWPGVHAKIYLNKDHYQYYTIVHVGLNIKVRRHWWQFWIK